MNDADPPMDEEIQRLTELIDGETDPTKKAELYFGRGFIYFKKEDYDNAIADLTQAIKLKPENPGAHLGRGRAYFGKEDYDKAITDLAQAIELNPKNQDAYLIRGRAYFGKEDYDKAITDLAQAIELNPKNQDAYLIRGRAYFEKEDYDKAITDLAQAIELNPKNQDAYLGRGSAYFGKEDYDKAITDFTQAIELKPENQDAYLGRGIAYLEKEDYDKAIADFTQAIELKPENQNAYLGRGIAYLRKENYDKAIADFTQAIELKPKNPNAYLIRGIAYSGSGKTDHAIADFDNAIELKPKNPNAHLERGRAYARKEDYNNAIKGFSSAGKQNSTIKLTIPLAYLASRIDDIFHQDAQNQKSEAFELYKKLLDIITLIQKALFIPLSKISQRKEVAHYTSLHALKELAGKESFRFYNVTYMNDPDEGRRFFEIMKDNKANVKKFFYKKSNQPYLSPAYIGSFTMVTSKKKQKDDLFLWRTYGKHDDKEAAGACLLFKHGGSCFAKRFKHQLGPIPQSLLDNESTLESRPQTKLSLYKISYPDDENAETLKYLKKLAKKIRKINCFNNKKQHKKKKKQLDELARDFLDTIRFLFKSDHYKAEKEVRIVEFHAYKENKTQPLDNNIKVDVKQIPPRFYVEAPENFYFSKVILGPRVRNSRDWKQWIEYEKKDPKVKVHQSNIKYGSPYS